MRQVALEEDSQLLVAEYLLEHCFAGYSQQSPHFDSKFRNDFPSFVAAVVRIHKRTEALHVRKKERKALEKMASFQPLEEVEAGSTTVGVKCAPFNPTHVECVGLALEMLSLNENEVLFDLGCGDGRFLIEGCRLHESIRGIGIEYDSLLCVRARAAIEAAGLSLRIDVHHQNVVDCDITTATAIFVYLVPTGIALIRAALEEAIERRVRVVTYVFSIPGLEPKRVEIFKKSTKLYLYSR